MSNLKGGEMTIETEVQTIVEKTIKEIQTETLSKADEALGKDPKALDAALWLLGDKFEREALARYKHNEEWAIRGTVRDKGSDNDTYHNIKEKLQQEIAQELTPEQLAKFPMEQVMSGLEETVENFIIAAVKLWQTETFDPLGSFEKKLKVQGRAVGTIKEYMNEASRFVAKCGRKRHYTDEEIVDFLVYQQEMFSPTTYPCKVAELKMFIKNLEPVRVFPIDVPKSRGKQFQPTLSKDQIDSLIIAGSIFLEGADLLHLATMTIYGARVSEVASLNYKDINLVDKTIEIPVTKRERIRKQPIPEFMLNIFSFPVKPCSKHKVERDLKHWARLAGFRLGQGVGAHAIRRGVASTLDAAGVDIYDLRNFGRWSSSEFGTVVSYIHTPTMKHDLEVLEIHPFVKTWQEALRMRESYLQKYVLYQTIYSF